MTNPRETYLAATVSTASPAQLLVMLYERLCLDLQRAADALAADAPEAAHAPLLHAQDIVLELRTTLRTDAWEGGPGLAALYDFLHRELVRANTGKDAAVLEFCRATAGELRDAWRQAALETLAASPVAATA